MSELAKLDLGCGPRARDGFQGVDIHPFEGVRHVVDLKQTPWPWADNSVAEAHSSHLIEHFERGERVQFWNELWRVLVPGGQCQIIAPDYSSGRAYGDPDHRWPPLSSFSFFYLKKDWRLDQAIHSDISVRPDGFSCDFDATWGYGLRPDLAVRSHEYQQFAIENYKEVCQDIVVMLTARKPTPAPRFDEIDAFLTATAPSV